MTFAELIREVTITWTLRERAAPRKRKSGRPRITQALVDRLLRLCFETIIEALLRGDDVMVPGFGRFTTTEMAARTVTSNLRGQEREYEVPARIRIVFKPSQDVVRRFNP